MKSRSAAAPRLKRHLLKTAGYGAVALAVLVLLVAAFYAWENYAGRAQWETYVAKAKQQGKPLTFPEMRPAPIPDEENFFAAPLFQQLVDPESTARKLFRLPAEGRPGFGATEPLEKWRTYAAKQLQLPGDDTRPAPEVILQFINQTTGAEWELLKRAAERPRSQYLPTWDSGFGLKVPFTTPLLTAAQLAGLRVRCHAAAADAGAAADDIHLMLRLADALTAEPTLVNALVEQAIFRIAAESIRTTIEHQLLNDAQVAELQQRLASRDWLQRYVFALETERGVLNDAAAFLLRDRKQAVREVLQPLMTMLDGKGKFALHAAHLYPRGWISANQLRSNVALDHVIARMRDERLRESTPPLEPEEPSSFFEAQKYFLYFVTVPIYRTMEERMLQTENTTRCARAACALERYRITHGELPDALDAVVPQFLSDVPRDVIGGGALRYRKETPASYTLYSVGSDRRDDGGVLEPPKPATQQKDWVWRCEPVPAVQ